MCKKDGCSIRPCFNAEGETKPLYCLAHKDVNMVCIDLCTFKTQIDL